MKNSLLILCAALGLAGCATNSDTGGYTFNHDPSDPDAVIRHLPLDPLFPTSGVSVSPASAEYYGQAFSPQTPH